MCICVCSVTSNSKNVFRSMKLTVCVRKLCMFSITHKYFCRCVCLCVFSAFTRAVTFYHRSSYHCFSLFVSVFPCLIYFNIFCLCSYAFQNKSISTCSFLIFIFFSFVSLSYLISLFTSLTFSFPAALHLSLYTLYSNSFKFFFLISFLSS